MKCWINILRRDQDDMYVGLGREMCLLEVGSALAQEEKYKILVKIIRAQQIKY